MTTKTTTPASPPKVNGYPVLASFATPGDRITRPGHVILVDRGPESPHRYVTAWIGEGDSSWCWGHYISERDQAEADFRSRCARGF